MHPENFAAIAENRISKCRAVMVEKAKEYSRDDDRLHNFKRAATMQGISPAEALRGMWAKHLVSVMDMIDSLSAGSVPSQKMVDEKIGDTINYAILFEGLIEEQRAIDLPVTPGEFASLEQEGWERVDDENDELSQSSNLSSHGLMDPLHMLTQRRFLVDHEQAPIASLRCRFGKEDIKKMTGPSVCPDECLSCSVRLSSK